MRKRLIVLLLLLFPISVFAYSDSLIVGGETIGIDVHSSGVYVVGFYPVNGENIGKNSGLEVGDIIKKVNDIEIHNIDELNDILMDSNQFQLKIQRGRKLIALNLNPIYENDILKTGLYVKDQINGIGTLSYIDPNSKIFGSLGHEIIESSSFSKFQINSGNIYKAEVSSINKSVMGAAGSKNAVIDKNDIIGDIKKNEDEGIFGFYIDDISEQELTPVGHAFDIHKGKAYIRTNILNDKVEDFSINIISIDEESFNKNIFFEINDKKLLKMTGGIVQGMSGSPILQDNRIIGVVNYVVVEEPLKGYGIFITTMLEEGDKIK